jgi:hypothetical protein
MGSLSFFLLLGLGFDFNHGFTLVISAERASRVGLDRAAALGTLAQSRLFQSQMGPSPANLAGRVALCWYWHSLIKCFKRLNDIFSII